MRLRTESWLLCDFGRVAFCVLFSLISGPLISYLHFVAGSYAIIARLI